MADVIDPALTTLINSSIRHKVDVEVTLLLAGNLVTGTVDRAVYSSLVIGPAFKLSDQEKLDAKLKKKGTEGEEQLLKDVGGVAAEFHHGYLHLTKVRLGSGERLPFLRVRLDAVQAFSMRGPTPRG